MLAGYTSNCKFYTLVIAVLLDIISDAAAEELVSEKVAEKPTEKPNVTNILDEIPKYHFRYHVQDSNSGDYKTQEESRDGRRVQGSYSVAEPNGDLRVVTYTADIDTGFKADVKFHKGGSPMTQALNRQLKPNRTSPHRNNFTPSKPRYMSPTMSPLLRTTPRYHSLGSGGLKTLGLHDLTRAESKQVAKEIVEKDSVVVEMHLNDGTTPEPASPKPEKAEEVSKSKGEVTAPKETSTPPSGLKTDNAVSVDKALKDKVRVEVEQIITSTLHQPTPVHEEIKKEAAKADKDSRGIHHPPPPADVGEARSSGRSANDKEELHISVHENVRPDDAQSRAQKKYSSMARPLRLVEQVPAGNYQMQTLVEPPNSNVENGNSYNNYDQPSGVVGNSNYYYDPTLAASVSNYYGGPSMPLGGNSLRPQSVYDQYPAESQQYAIGYEWIKMNPRMVNSNGESFIVMDPDYTSSKTYFGYPRPTTLFHHLTKNKFKPHEKPTELHAKPQDNKYELNKPQDPKDQPATSVKEPVMVALKNAPAPAPTQITPENSPKHDQQVPLYFRKDQEKQIADSKNQTQKYLESLQAAPQPYPMVPATVPGNGIIKQLPVIQPATINPIPAYAWPAGPVAINPAIAFILLPLQAAQDPPIAPLIVN